jgi:hypothetical protein
VSATAFQDIVGTMGVRDRGLGRVSNCVSDPHGAHDGLTLAQPNRMATRPRHAVGPIVWLPDHAMLLAPLYGYQTTPCCWPRGISRHHVDWVRMSKQSVRIVIRFRRETNAENAVHGVRWDGCEPTA